MAEGKDRNQAIRNAATDTVTVRWEVIRPVTVCTRHIQWASCVECVCAVCFVLCVCVCVLSFVELLDSSPPNNQRNHTHTHKNQHNAHSNDSATCASSATTILQLALPLGLPLSATVNMDACRLATFVHEARWTVQDAAIRDLI